jgi:membrane protease YdiL (CAAX protease family)
MRMVAGGLLILCLGEMWYFVRRDVADYAAFKLLTHTADRQRRYRVWILKSLLLFSGTSLIGLALLGRLDALRTLPAEFLPLFDRFKALPSPSGQIGSGFLVGFGGALLVGVILGGLASRFIVRKKQPAVLGDVESLMPRNWAETAHAGLLSLNAGLSEELFFRLLLPLLLVILFGNVVAAFVAAALIFGAIHWYQGRIGVIATTVLGGVFTVIYLWTGNIWIAVAAHAGLDLLSLVVRPSIARVLTRQSAG